MELRYCEECGDGIKVERGQPSSLPAPYVCAHCREGKASQERPGAAKRDADVGNWLQDVSLDLFSTKTIAFRKQKLDGVPGAQEKSKSSRLRLVKSPAIQLEGAGAAGTGEASAPTQQSAQKLVFRCFNCRSTLSMRPVERTSKLSCPQCKTEIYVTTSGRILRNSPSILVKKSAEQSVTGAQGARASAGSTVCMKPPALDGTAPRQPSRQGASSSDRPVSRQQGSIVVLQNEASPEGRNPGVADPLACKTRSIRLVTSNPKAPHGAEPAGAPAAGFHEGAPPVAEKPGDGAQAEGVRRRVRDIQDAGLKTEKLSGSGRAQLRDDDTTVVGAGDPTRGRERFGGSSPRAPAPVPGRPVAPAEARPLRIQKAEADQPERKTTVVQ